MPNQGNIILYSRIGDIEFCYVFEEDKIQTKKGGKGSWEEEREELVIFWKVKVKETG